MIRAAALSLFFLAGLAGSAAAQTCGFSYTVRPGDSLSVIAERQYSNAFAWTGLYRANQAVIGPDPDRILVGSELFLPCVSDGTVAEVPAVTDVGTDPFDPGPEASDAAVAAVPAETVKHPLIVSQWKELPPFTDARRPDSGMISELVRAASATGFPRRQLVLARSAPDETALVSDLIYPVVRPGCPPSAGRPACRDFLYSEPLFEMLMVFFVSARAPLPLVSDEDLRGKRLCTPIGHPVHVLDSGSRNWLSDNLVTLVRAADADGCFDNLRTGNVDAVLLNEFTGRAAISAAGREDETIALTATPVDIVTLNVAVPRTAPDADGLIEAFNAGLREIRETGAYQDILNRHMDAVWAGF